ncbi:MULTISPECIES: hypothetical protein [Halorussus]|uniref:hypothetical protein n=1 Tax=Halorussus TaxID=1070314 RepID=UPI0020A19474|nr:hypothetical protein [Halorussus vallis]USZ77220.1 hypothetical protein NGM07_07780 [Halorussus vallis]
MATDPERDRGILSTKDRQFLLDEAAIESKSSAERVARSRIRDRILNALLDFSIIADELEDRDKKRVFENLPRDLDLRRSIVALLGFVYLGVKECGEDFGDLLAKAVEEAEKTRASVDDRRAVEVDVTFDVETKLVLESTADNLEKYSERELAELVVNDELSGDELYQELQRRRAADAGE